MDYDSDAGRADAGRRRFLKQTVALGGLLLGGRALASATHAMPSAEATPDFNPDVEMELAAVVDVVGLLPGTPTTVWRFTGKVLRGNADALTFLKSSDSGPSFVPVIRARRGQKVRIFFTNRLLEQSIVHWHGLHIAQHMDGHPMYAIGRGSRYVYEFMVDNRAGTYWFHPHPHERTGFQVYHGLAGFFLVGDDEEDAAQLPHGAFDLPLVIQDRTFDSRNAAASVTMCPASLSRAREPDHQPVAASTPAKPSVNRVASMSLRPLPDSCIGSRLESRVISVLLSCASVEERLVRGI
jgi:FtsP/CotA-like multicopper oxidase with cupredoxin domain